MLVVTHGLLTSSQTFQALRQVVVEPDIARVPSLTLAKHPCCPGCVVQVEQGPAQEVKAYRGQSLDPRRSGEILQFRQSLLARGALQYGSEPVTPRIRVGQAGGLGQPPLFRRMFAQSSSAAARAIRSASGLAWIAAAASAAGRATRSSPASWKASS